MAKKDINDPEIQKSINNIILQIQKRKVIPIIGYDLLLDEFEEDTSEDFLNRLIKMHAAAEMQTMKIKNEKTGYELINSYYHSLLDFEPFKQELSKTIQENRINLMLIPDSYRKLVCIKNLKFFINATFTNSLELALNSFRASGKNEIDIKDSYKVLNYQFSEPMDLSDPAPEKNFEITFSKPIIYNLFSTHDDERGAYVLTDTDYIELMYDLIRNTDGKFKNLLTYFKEGYLLFLGCNFPDWFFRFFIRLCVGEKNLTESSPITRKAVIDSLNNNDSSRSVFMGHYKIQTLDVDCNQLINEIYKKLLNEPGSPGLVGNKGIKKVFISYCRNDEQVANDIAVQFEERYIEYFKDNAVNNLLEGEGLSNKITEAIDNCLIFLVIISANIENSTPYIWLELQYAINTKKIIWPLFKEFVKPNISLPDDVLIDQTVLNNILTETNPLGIITEGESNKISESKIIQIKKKQILSRAPVNGNIYISYCKGDEQVALDIAAQFEDKFIDFILGKNELFRNNINNKMSDAIDKCSLFIPIVSRKITNSESTIWDEWNYAISMFGQAGNEKIWPAFKEFINPNNILLPAGYNITPEVTNKILNKNNTLGIFLQGEGNLIAAQQLIKIKDKQYLSRVSGDKQTKKD